MTKALQSETPMKEISTSEEKTLSEEFIHHLDKLKKLNITKDLNLFLSKDCSYVSLTPIIPTHKLDFLFKLYKIPLKKEDLYIKLKQYLSLQETKVDKKYFINNILIHNCKGNITIVDDQFNKKCILLSKTSNDAMQLIADKIALGIFSIKKIIYKYEKKDKNIFVITNLKSDENAFVSSSLFENERKARNDVNKKIIIKYLPKRVVKEIMKNIEKLLKHEDEIKCEQKERYEKHLQAAGNDRKLLNNKRKLTNEEFYKRLPYFNLLHKNPSKKLLNKYLIKDDIRNNKISNNDNILPLDEEKEFSSNSQKIPLNEILLGDANIVNYHLRDFKYTPLKIFEMIRDSEKYRGVDLKLEYSNINDKKYNIKIESTIISQKLGIKVEGYGNSKEEAANKCSLNFLSIIFKNIFRTFHQVHDYFEHKNKRYLDIILKPEDNEDDNINMNYNTKRKKVIDDSDSSNSLSKSLSSSDENKKSKSSSDSQENYYKFDLDQMLDSELISNTESKSSGKINIVSKMNNYDKNNHSSNSFNTSELEELMKNSSFGLSASNYSISNGSKKKN